MPALIRRRIVTALTFARRSLLHAAMLAVFPNAKTDPARSSRPFRRLGGELIASLGLSEVEPVIHRHLAKLNPGEPVMLRVANSKHFVTLLQGSGNVKIIDVK